MLTSHSVLVLAAALLVSHAKAHSNMILPLPTWSVGWSTNSFAATIQGNTYLPIPNGMSYSTDPADNTETYWTAFNKSTYTSLKDLIDKTGEFTSSHEGSCEVWCDDTLVFEDWNCAVDYTSDPAKLPYDKSKCEGASMLTSYWLALHGLPWQAYINCAPLTGSVASGSVASSSTSTTTTTTTAPVTTTATPTSTTTTATSTPSTATTSEESSTTTDASASDVGGEAETTDSPATTTAAPTTLISSDKCSVRRRRN
ncbi:hypothetical protein V7S43_003926 [Phytophthora oleae]|uniref:Uncharacterized protein n=1 Tax=Phytophthora oleae TaxID=2107226 RepID=A0ABD3FVG6_9STRA